MKNENENKKYNNIIDNCFKEDLNITKNNDHEISILLSKIFINNNKSELINNFNSVNSNQKTEENIQLFEINNQITENNI